MLTHFKQSTQETLRVVALALSNRRFPCTWVAAALKCDKATVSRRVTRIQELAKEITVMPEISQLSQVAQEIKELSDTFAKAFKPKRIDKELNKRLAALQKISSKWNTKKPRRVLGEFEKRLRSFRDFESLHEFMTSPLSSQL